MFIKTEQIKSSTFIVIFRILYLIKRYLESDKRKISGGPKVLKIANVEQESPIAFSSETPDRNTICVFWSDNVRRFASANPSFGSKGSAVGLFVLSGPTFRRYLSTLVHEEKPSQVLKRNARFVLDNESAHKLHIEKMNF